MAESSSTIPRNKRWSAVSASANADMAAQLFLKNNPHTYDEHSCLCKLPGDEDENEWDDENEDEDEEGNEKKSEGKETQSTKCDGGETCVCGKLAADHPGHPFIFSKAAMNKLSTYTIFMDLRDPDNFSMYTFNDHSAYGALEVMQNVLLDFQDASGNLKQRWMVCEALALLLASNYLAPVMMADDGYLVKSTVAMLERMFVTILAELEKHGSLGAHSDVHNLGLVMGLYASNINAIQSHLPICLDPEEETDVFQETDFVPYLLEYARKHNIIIHGPSGIDEIIADAEDEAEENDIKLPPAKNDPWGWGAAFKKYEKESRIPYFSERRKTKIGGDSLDISTFSSQERKKASFTKKDPFTAGMIKDIKEGLVLQLS